MLDGFSVPPENYHTVANGLHWGPDGWLYGRAARRRSGASASPARPKPSACPIYGGLWRFHPGRKTFEMLAHGTTNPWGNDWNDLGEAFFVNTVNGHLWHAVAGMHFVRRPHDRPQPAGLFADRQHADHWHWDNAKDWTDSRSASGEHDRRGGGHAHCGAMIYLGDQWPAAYRDKLFTLNLHGRRVNVDRLERSGCGYAGRHEPDMIFAGDYLVPRPRARLRPRRQRLRARLERHRRVPRGQRASTARRAGSTRSPTAPRRAGPAGATSRGCDERALVDLREHPNEWYVPAGPRCPGRACRAG